MRALKCLSVLASAVLISACVSAGSSRNGSNVAVPADAAGYNLELGIGYLRQGRLTAAREKLEKALDQDPGLVTAHAALGLVYERLEDPGRAEVHYRRAVDLDPNDPDALNALAVFTCMTRQRPAEALRLFDRALAVPLSRKETNRSMLHTNAGICARQVDLERAEQYLRGALALDPQHAEALLQVADVSLARGDALRARAFIERHLAVAPPSVPALVLAMRIEQVLGDDAARGRYRDVLQEKFPNALDGPDMPGPARDGG